MYACAGMCCSCLEGRVSGGLACSFRRWAAPVPERAVAAAAAAAAAAERLARPHSPLTRSCHACGMTKALSKKPVALFFHFSSAGAAPHRRPLSAGIEIRPVTGHHAANSAPACPAGVTFSQMTDKGTMKAAQEPDKS
ncbi:hypothetical protein L1887_48405 [Cichorium endivia]|nr:hypothetical protein L1887_48405 [Cichorium endivia]